MEPDWSSRNRIQKLIDNADLHDRDNGGGVVLWRDKAGAGVSIVAAKGVLNAILGFWPKMFPSIETIAARSGLKRRTVQRVIEVLQAKDILAVETKQTGRGKQSHYSFLLTKLAYLGGDGRMPLFKEPSPPKPSATGTTPSATTTDPSAMVAHPSATGGARASATGGAIRTIVKTNEDLRKRNVDSNFLNDEIQEFLIHAKRLGKLIPGTVDDQGDILRKFAMWRVTGEISEFDFEECITSTESNRPDYPFGYFWQSVFERIESGGRDFYQLLRETRIP